MGTYGLTMRYYPRGVLAENQYLVLEVSEWTAKRPTMEHDNISVQVDLGPEDDVDPNDPQWMLMVLQSATSIVEAQIALRDAGFISGANGTGDLASEKPSQQM